MTVEEVLDLASGVLPALVPRDQVIRNEEEWCAFWDEVHAFFDPAPPCDTELVDFQSEVVLASIGPLSGSGCSDTEVARVQRLARRGRGRALLVDVRDTSPGPGCICTLSFQSPVHAVVVPQPVGRVYFRHHGAVLDCERE